MIGFTVFTFWIVSSTALAGTQQAGAVVIPYAPPNSGKIVTDSAIRKAFPQLPQDAKQKSVCMNFMMGGAGSIVYQLPPSGHTVTIESADCHQVKGGLSCSPLSQQVNHFFESPEHPFTLKDGVTYDQAITILRAFRDHGIAGLSKKDKALDYHWVNQISKAGDVYTLRLGEFFCGGCVERIKVTVHSDGKSAPSLKLVGAVTGVCI